MEFSPRESPYTTNLPHLSKSDFSFKNVDCNVKFYHWTNSYTCLIQICILKRMEKFTVHGGWEVHENGEFHFLPGIVFWKILHITLRLPDQIVLELSLMDGSIKAETHEFDYLFG